MLIVAGPVKIDLIFDHPHPGVTAVPGSLAEALAAYRRGRGVPRSRCPAAR